MEVLSNKRNRQVDYMNVTLNGICRACLLSSRHDAQASPAAPDDDTLVTPRQDITSLFT